MYDSVSTAPLRREITKAGIVELLTPKDVDHALAHHDTTLLFVNSICGCTAKTARPGLVKALEHQPRPARAFSVFAGADKEATARARHYFVGYPPSSPSLAIFRGGVLVHFFDRHEIEGIDAQAFTNMVIAAFNRYCGPEVDPSIPIPNPMSEIEIEPHELQGLIRSGHPPVLIDCRDDQERKQAQIPGSLIYSPVLTKEITDKWERNREVVLFCHTGRKSLTAVKMFRKFGFTRVRRLRGGIDAWSREVDPEVPIYTRTSLTPTVPSFLDL